MHLVGFAVETVFLYLILLYDVSKSLAIALAFSRITLIMKAWVRSLVSPSGFCGGYSSTGLGFFRVFWFSSGSVIPQVLRSHLHPSIALSSRTSV